MTLLTRNYLNLSYSRVTSYGGHQKAYLFYIMSYVIYTKTTRNSGRCFEGTPVPPCTVVPYFFPECIRSVQREIFNLDCSPPVSGCSLGCLCNLDLCESTKEPKTLRLVKLIFHISHRYNNRVPVNLRESLIFYT